MKKNHTDTGLIFFVLWRRDRRGHQPLIRNKTSAMAMADRDRTNVKCAYTAAAPELPLHNSVLHATHDVTLSAPVGSTQSSVLPVALHPRSTPNSVLPGSGKVIIIIFLYAFIYMWGRGGGFFFITVLGVRNVDGVTVELFGTGGGGGGVSGGGVSVSGGCVIGGWFVLKAVERPGRTAGVAFLAAGRGAAGHRFGFLGRDVRFVALDRVHVRQRIGVALLVRVQALVTLENLGRRGGGRIVG